MHTTEYGQHLARTQKFIAPLCPGPSSLPLPQLQICSAAHGLAIGQFVQN